ncbi:Integral membrane protein sed5 [Neolecta irregularis DAH-3]|uniref:Integral membrane protein sed5 n=1 Tax=Neolecta irregularis (strain DAH-3) TaxID=1198029 RepID=A0A1U7LKH8_NEOID|nr:Integral membrane protein sed5 [Neolecta irregularis DAH-3]|eukprot:OLL23160.1 Integral membrane protein sed5 [Neolecta irregularis DAH-3]
MSAQNRTAEFLSCVASARPNSHAFSTESLIQLPPAKSDFFKHASQIGKDLNTTVQKLERLAQLAKRKTLFDDRPVEISELTYIIKQDIAHLNLSISELGKNSKLLKGKRKQTAEHHENVIVLLQSKLANTSIGFKDILEIRTKNMKESRSRTEQFISDNAAAAIKPNSSPLYRSRANTPQPRPNNDLLDLDAMESRIETPPLGQFQQMQLVEQQNTYIDQRASAIENIESTIAELGGIFTQLAQMVSEQRDVVQRIDATTDDIATNVSSAQKELLKYYARVTSNRWLMVKIFGILIIFFLLWVLVS